ncbi:DUF5658 family protein [Microbacterium sp. APC 3898]|uniref:DUF5658 family protein n=2 Tax=Planococcus TaxID=1372 RepID=A0ABT7ZM82_9BACL|nr:MULTISPECIES: DUF5658 family protein [Terrabacteria group]MBD8015382.1 hypothetical protein [Planococcus wigleyi]MDN3428269.1 DUF5658 family protein [Planococcus sp. APC 4016]MDN3439412.1 DUF5658 family protein [Planococcus sp. APC 3900]MDN3498193.1 DUF5658 family protein [Microbacterium sp. APC 3898]
MGTEERSTPLKKHIWSLVILNFLDGFLTYMGLSFGAITEANPLLASFSPLALLVTKFLLSLCLFGFLYTPFVRIQSRNWRYTLILVNTLYSLILLLHLFWLLILFT